MRSLVLVLLVTAAALTLPGSVPFAFSADEGDAKDAVVSDVLMMLDAGVDPSVIEDWLTRNEKRPAPLEAEQIVELTQRGAPRSLVVLLNALAAGTPIEESDEPIVRAPAAPSVSAGTAGAGARRSPPPRREAPASSSAPTPSGVGRARAPELGTAELPPRPAPGGGRADSPRIADERQAALESLRDLLLGQEIKRLEIQATSYEEAISIINIFVEDLLERTSERYDSPVRAAEHAAEVLRGLNDHEVDYDGQVFGTRNVIVRDAEEARLASEMVDRVMRIIDRGAETLEGEVSYRWSAQQVFDQVLIDPEVPVQLVRQYSWKIEEMSEWPQTRLSRLIQSRPAGAR